MEGAENAAPPDWLEQIDHTADVGIVVRAENLEDLFARAGWGMFSVITDMGDVRLPKEVGVRIEAEDKEELLLRWLSELNFLHITRHELYARFEIKSLSERELRASAFGEGVDLERHTIYTEIKAVTFHGLSIKQMEAGWEARVIFDM